MATKKGKVKTVSTTGSGRGRPRQCLVGFSCAFRLEQSAGLDFYAHSNSRDKADILRHIVRTFLLLDKNLDDKAFAKYVKEYQEPMYKDDPEMLETLRTRVKDLLDERAKQHRKR